MQTENQDLRGKIEIMENILGADLEKQQQGGLFSGLERGGSSSSKQPAPKYDWVKIMTEERPSDNIKLDIINELHCLRKEKTAQGNRIKSLEMENMQLQAQINPNHLYGEPTRSYIDSQTKGNQLPNVARTKTANESTRQQIMKQQQSLFKNALQKRPQLVNQFVMDDSLQPVNFNEQRCRSQKKFPEDFMQNIQI